MQLENPEIVLDLPDRRRFWLNAELWEAFQDALDAPITPAPRIVELLNQPSAIEKGNF